MNRLLEFGVLGLVVSLLLLCLPQSVSADWHQINTGAVERDVFFGSYTSQQWTLAPGYKVRYQWTSGSVPVTFGVADEYNFNEWVNGRDSVWAVVRDGLTQDDFEFQVSYSGTWRVVWIDYTIWSTHISGSWYLYEWREADFHLENPSRTSVSMIPAAQGTTTTTVSMQLRNYGNDVGTAELSTFVINLNALAVEALVSPTSIELSPGEYCTVTVTISIGSVFWFDEAETGMIQVAVRYYGNLVSEVYIDLTVTPLPAASAGMPIIVGAIGLVIAVAAVVGAVVVVRHRRQKDKEYA